MLRSSARQSAVRAVDTNILVRFFAADDEKQSPVARALIVGADVFVPTTVVLETEWVLRSAYGFAPSAIANSLRMLGGLPRVSLENAVATVQALDLLEQGVDFADALHLIQSAHCEAFVTFDRKLARRAKTTGAPRIELL